MTVAELADLGVDGFISMLNWTEASIRRYASTHLIMPTASTIGEAFDQTRWGAHFQKMPGNNLDLVRQCRLSPAFDFCPILVTGGQTPERMPETIQAGAVLVASGFDLMLKGMEAPTVDRVAGVLRHYRDSAHAARAACWPELAAKEGTASDEEWLSALPHWHPF